MSYIALDRAKQFLEYELSDRDALIAFLIDAAEASAVKFLGAPLTEYLQDTSGDSVPDLDQALQPDVELGILQYVAEWFEQRRINSEAPLNTSKAAEQILHFHRVGLGV